ncbi:MAG: adenylate/guanylate cyclase domain-containing protein [Deltaproteobacteria bacterium]|nr:adenylate/guanylate cyclase domain-containing protein [Deltaproteobacteria bacterium]
MPRETTSLTIMFADIARSTRFYETLGDISAQRLMSTCLSRLSDVACQHQGSVIKTIGDEVMCTFPDADQAVNAAKNMQEAFEKMPDIENCDLGTPNIYIGIHTGPVIKEEDDIFGDSVILAARMVALAKPRQILITEQTVKALTPDYKAFVRYVDKETIKGKKGKLKIYEYIWEQDDVTVILERSSTSSVLQSYLELRCGNVIIKVDHLQPSITMGRQSHNDLVLDYERISRSHANIENSREKFILMDHSSNGTYVHPQGEAVIHITRDEVQLFDSGIISLGRKASPGSPGAIHYTVKQ